MAVLIELKIEGMHCDGCVRRVSALLRQLPGVRLEDVKVGSARLELSSPPTTRADLLAALQAAGFPSS